RRRRLRLRVLGRGFDSHRLHQLTTRSRMDTARKSALLFDFGGTLDADGLAWKERVYRLFRDEGVAVGRERFDPLFHAADDALVGTIPPTTSFDATVARLVAAVAEALGLADRPGGTRGRDAPHLARRRGDPGRGSLLPGRPGDPLAEGRGGAPVRHPVSTREVTRRPRAGRHGEG